MMSDLVGVSGPDDWRRGFLAAVRQFMERHGEPVAIDPEAELVSRTYSVFGDTFHGNDDEVGLNMGPAACACGAYTGVTLRYVGSLGDILPRLLGIKEQ